MKSNILLWEGEKAIVTSDEEIQNTDRTQLHKKLENSELTPAEARQALFSADVKKEVTLSPFEVKQHFISKGDFENAQKAEKIGTDRPTQAIKKIKTEISFFGLAFLEGFLDVYGIKQNNAISRYENRLQIIEEQQFNTGERKASIYQVIRGRLEKVREYSTSREAQEQIETFNLKQDKKIYGGLKNEIPKKGE